MSRVPSPPTPNTVVPAAGPPERGDRLQWRVEIALVVASTLAALLLRVIPPWRHVFAGGAVWFQENDPWYHVRVAEAWIANFPHRLTLDPYLQHPGGGGMPLAPFLDLLLALPPALLGLSEHAARVWMAFVPALLGAAGVVLVWGLARTVFDRRAALLAAGLIAVEPGGYLVRTLLGFTDHHALEAALTLAVLCALASALRASGRRRLGWSIAAGAALGCYLLGWGGGALLVAVLAVWAALQSLLEGPRPWGSGLAPVLLPVFVGAGVLVASWLGTTPRFEIQMLALGGAAAGVVALDALRATAARRGLGRGAFAAASLVAGAAILVAGWLVLFAAAPGVAVDLRYQVLRFVPSGAALTVGEVRPLLLYGDELSWLPAWLTFRTSLFLGLAGMGWCSWLWWRDPRRDLGVVLVWALAMLLATLGQVRFGYYLGPAFALFAAPVCGAILDLSGAAAGRDASRASRAFYRGVAATVVALLAFAPSAASALVSAGADRTPPERWREAMAWLRRETPEPFGDPSAYLRRTTDAGTRWISDYGVLSWWDYGYWIIGLARRVPVSNPTQLGAREAAALFLETDGDRALRTLDELGARYVVTEAGFAITPNRRGTLAVGRFDAMCQWAEVASSRYYEPVLLPDASGTLRPSVLFRPDYYRTMVARLAALGTQAVPARGRVLVAELRRPEDGRSDGPSTVVSTRWFESAGEAEEALRAGAVRGSIFGTDPLRPPVDLEALVGIDELASFEGVRIVGLRARAEG